VSINFVDQANAANHYTTPLLFLLLLPAAIATAPDDIVIIYVAVLMANKDVCRY